MSNFFEGAPIIFAYSRQQAIEDGVLVDVTETAREAGFVYPVALTADLWADINAIPPSKQGFEDVAGRLWDLLYMAVRAIKQSRESGTCLLYRLILHVGKRSDYTVKLVCGPGDDAEPVITLMRPDED